MAQGTRMQVLPKLQHGGFVDVMDHLMWQGKCMCDWRGPMRRTDTMARADMHEHIGWVRTQG